MATNGAETDPDQLVALRKLDPTEQLEGADPSSAEAQAILTMILKRTEAESAGAAGAVSRSRRLRFALVGAGALALASAALLAIDLQSEDGSIGVSRAEAALIELSLAAGADGRVEPTPGEDQYYYRRQVGFGSSSEFWVALDGSGGYRSDSFEDGELQLTEADPELISIGQTTQISYREFLDLPRDPDRLYDLFAADAALEVPSGVSDFEAEQIRQENESTPANQRMFSLIQSIFVQVPVPPDLRAALFEVMQNIDGIRLLGRVKTEAGRTGIGLGMYRGDVSGPNDPDAPIAVDGTPVTTREDLIFDEQTGQFIGYRTGNPGSQEGSAFDTAIVDRIGQRP